MAAKIKLGNCPKTFKPIPIEAELPDGEMGKMTVTYKYFTKTDSGKLVDEMVAAAKANETHSDDDASQENGYQSAPAVFSMEDIMSKTRDHNAGYMLRVIDSWDLDEPVTLEKLKQLDNECPAVSVAIMSAFRTAAQTGKLGN